MCHSPTLLHTLSRRALQHLFLAASLLAITALRAAESPLIALGFTEPIIDVTLSASVPGIISALNVAEGDRITKGDVILELDKRLEELEVDRRKRVMDIRKMDLDATATLYETTKAVSKEELDKKRADFLVSMAEFHMAEEQLNRRHIVAPYSGIITELRLDVGEATEAYAPLIRLVDPTLCHFECNLEARLAAPLTLNQAVRMEIDSGAGPVKVAGVVTFISPVADKASGLINVKVRFDNSDGRVRPGLAGRLIIRE